MLLTKKNFIAFQTILYKEIHRFTRIWIQTLLPPVITTTLYFIIFGNLIGRHVPMMEGYHYIDFIVPGLVMMAIINNAYTNVVFSFFSAKFQKNIEEILVSPMPNLFILLGYIAGGVTRGLFVGTIVLIIALFFSNVTIQHPILMLVIAFITCILFSLGGFINAMYSRKFDDVNIIPVFILAPLTYLGGVFYSINLLPPIWQKITLLNPLLYIVDAYRYSFLGISDINIYYALGTIIVLTLVLFGFALRLLNRGYGLRT